MSWSVFSGFCSGCERFGWLPLRKRALERANFVLSESACDGADQQLDLETVAWRRVALHALGHAPSSRIAAACESAQHYQTDEVQDDGHSDDDSALPVDTAQAIEALAASGVDLGAPTLEEGFDWLVVHRLPEFVERPTIVDIAPLLTAASCVRSTDATASSSLPPALRLAARPLATLDHPIDPSPTIQFDSLADALVRECCRRQRPDGGWARWNEAPPGASSRGHLRTRACRAVQISEPESTSFVLTLLAREESPKCQRALRRGGAYLRHLQRGDGSWPSSVCGFLSGTTWAIRGLVAAGAAPDDPAVAGGVNWLLVQQGPSGGWSESTEAPDSQPGANSTAIETAAAVIALVAAGLADHDATRRGIQFLIAAQNENGAWSDTTLAEHDAPIGAWYRCELHSTCWSLLAIARWAAAIGGQSVDEPPALRLAVHDAI